MNTRNLILAAAAAAGLCAGQAWGATIQSVGSGFWDVDTTWSGGNVPTNTDDVTIADGCTVTIRTNAANVVKSLTIQTNAVLTHLTNGTTAAGERYKVVLDITDSLTIEAGGAISADGKGYASKNGPGNTSGDGGGSYGGRGFYSAGGLTYGSITAPTNCGSGGNYYAGGGAVVLRAGSGTVVNGMISANGAGVDYYSGSGGSVFLRTGTLAGSGTIRANGGILSNEQSGGGGRVAVILTNSADFGSVKLEAYAGSGSGKRGAGGTIYLEHTNHVAARGKLIVDYGPVVPGDLLLCVTIQNGQSASSNAFAEIILTNGAIYALDSNDALDISGTTVYGSPANRNEGFHLLGGTLTVPSSFGFTNYLIGIRNASSTFAPAALTVGTNANLRIDVPWTLAAAPVTEAGGALTFNAPLTVNGSLTIPAGAVLEHSANVDTETYKLNVSVNGDLNIQTNGAVNADGKGYAAKNGPGAPPGDGGGSYGGRGYRSDKALLTYGSITAPTNCGSGGNYYAGGGAVRLNVTGGTVVSGVISANGGGSSGAETYYSGAGGSVFLTTATLTGNGTIRANGGSINNSQSGGGGRLAVILTNSVDFGSVKIEAYAGTAASLSGAAGTIYTETPAQGVGQGTLLINANNIVAGATWVVTMIGPNITDTAVGTAIFTNKAVVALSNQTLTVRGNWENRATFIAFTNSTVDFTGARPATIWTNNAFFNLACTNAGKTLSFEAGRTNTVNGILKLGASQSGQTVTLQSTTNGSWSYLTLVSGGTQTIARVNVKDNNAGGGQTLLAGNGSANGGNNINWQFPPSGTIFMVQ